MGLKTYWFTLPSCGLGSSNLSGRTLHSLRSCTGEDARTTFRARRASERSKSSVKKVQRVFVIIHEVDALARDIDESEQGTGSHRARVVQ